MTMNLWGSLPLTIDGMSRPHERDFWLTKVSFRVRMSAWKGDATAT